MKKLYLCLLTALLVSPAFCADKYSCNYMVGNSFYQTDYNVNTTPDAFCKLSFDENKCKREEYPALLKAYKEGKCKKILSKKYNIEVITINNNEYFASPFNTTEINKTTIASGELMN